MSKTQALRMAITAKLQELCPRVYYGQAKSKTERPYIVYTLEQIDQADDLMTMELEANVMDYGQDTSPAENLSDAVMASFDRFYYMDKEIQFSAYPTRQQPVTEEDRSVIRRRLLIEIHLHERRTV